MDHYIFVVEQILIFLTKIIINFKNKLLHTNTPNEKFQV